MTNGRSMDEEIAALRQRMAEFVTAVRLRRQQEQQQGGGDDGGGGGDDGGGNGGGGAPGGAPGGAAESGAATGGTNAAAAGGGTTAATHNSMINTHDNDNTNRYTTNTFDHDNDGQASTDTSSPHAATTTTPGVSSWLPRLMQRVRGGGGGRAGMYRTSSLATPLDVSHSFSGALNSSGVSSTAAMPAVAGAAVTELTTLPMTSGGRGGGGQSTTVCVS